ncbi:MAG TPA: prepilin-type N-terminal cleavage/methylation domain-containing protein [Opitutaceae bacterium]|nr:prepilin-type N-terminal cleavage/methylation domain-containing protein [Opitutaceae bacterium]
MNFHYRISLARRAAPRTAFTLVEVVVAMTVFGLAMAGVMSVFLGTLKSTHAIADAVDWNSRSRFVQERLLFDLRAITEVSEIKSALGGGEVAKIFADYTGTEVTHCYRSFTSTIEEYNGTGTIDVTYAIVADGPLWALQRTVDGKSQKVLTNLQDGCFTFYTRNSTGALSSLGSTDFAKANAIRFAFLPRGRGPLVPGENDPSCSAVVQLRYPTYKAK